MPWFDVEPHNLPTLHGSLFRAFVRGLPAAPLAAVFGLIDRDAMSAAMLGIGALLSGFWAGLGEDLQRRGSRCRQSLLGPGLGLAWVLLSAWIQGLSSGWGALVANLERNFVRRPDILAMLMSCGVLVQLIGCLRARGCSVAVQVMVCTPALAPLLYGLPLGYRASVAMASLFPPLLALGAVLERRFFGQPLSEQPAAFDNGRFLGIIVAAGGIAVMCHDGSRIPIVPLCIAGGGAWLAIAAAAFWPGVLGRRPLPAGPSATADRAASETDPGP